jgi:hypothetical protein
VVSVGERHAKQWGCETEAAAAETATVLVFVQLVVEEGDAVRLTLSIVSPVCSASTLVDAAARPPDERATAAR